jgi:RNA polymerase sigma-70 factor (ECF subfamily)
VSSEPRVHDSDWVSGLFESHAPAVLAYARRRLESAEDAEDVVTEVFTTAWRRRSELPEEALPWLYATAAHCVAHTSRARARRSRLGTRLATVRPLHPVDADPAQTVADALDARAAVADALDALGDPDAELLRLWAWEQLEPAEIAVVLGCSPGAARTRLHRARTRLREALVSRGLTGSGIDAPPHPATGSEDPR